MSRNIDGTSGAATGLSGLDKAIANRFGAAPSAEPASAAPTDTHRLGSLSERYESSGRGPGTVSTGLRDPGGVSYGLYQLATRTGTAAAFVAAEGARWQGDFAGKKPGSSAFSAAWQAIAARDPAAFAAAQHAFIERTHYRPAVAAALRQAGLDMDRRANAVRDACWSVAVQHGSAALILCRAIAAADKQAARTSAGYDRALIEAIYAARSAYVRKVAAGAEPGARRTLLDIVARRYPAELKQALEQLARDG